MEFKSKARKHFLLDRWTDALQFELQEFAMPCRSKEDEGWMREVCTEVLHLSHDHFDKVHSKKKMEIAPNQLIEFPNFLQRTHKLYVDWDKKLSEVEKLGEGFLPHRHSSNENEYGVVHRRANVERIRQLALQTPQAVLHLLKKMGCELQLPPSALICCRDDDDVEHSNCNETTVKVYVKEGTRPMTPDGKDWKISFHFVFQVKRLWAFIAHVMKISLIPFYHCRRSWYPLPNFE